MSILIFLVILLVLVLVHEFGHFYSAKKFGIRVDEFGFGFPPKLFGYKWGETEYTFNLFPLGGFVKIFGENPEVKQAHYGVGPNEDYSRSFQYKAKWKQAVVLFAGVSMNFLLAWFLFSFGFISGLPTSVGSEPKGYDLQNVSLTIVTVSPKSPAESAGLKSGDKIVSIKSDLGSKSYISGEEVKSFVVQNSNRELEIGYTRGLDKNINSAKMTPKDGVIGISMDQIGTLKLPILIAFAEGMKITLTIVKSTVLGLYGLIRDGLLGRGDLSTVTGPVGLVGVVGDAYKFGFSYLLSFTALISVNLAVINLLPFPALDGGRLFFLLIEKIKGSKINPQFFNIANIIGFSILILFMIVVTYNDVIKLL